MANTHLSGCMCLYCVFWWCCFWHWALKRVMVPDSTGLYVGLVGWCDIDCKFRSTFSRCVLPYESICINCRLCMVLSDLQQCAIIAFCIVFEWYFVLVFFPYFICIFFLCFVYKFITLFSPVMESVYWSHSRPLTHVPVWLCVLFCQVWSQWIICQYFM